MTTPPARNDIPIYRYFLIATSCGRSITFRFGRMTTMYSVGVRNWVGDEVSGHGSLVTVKQRISNIGKIYLRILFRNRYF